MTKAHVLRFEYFWANFKRGHDGINRDISSKPSNRCIGEFPNRSKMRNRDAIRLPKLCELKVDDVL